MFDKLLAWAAPWKQPSMPRTPLAPICIDSQWETGFASRPRIRVLPYRGKVWLPVSDVHDALQPSADELARGRRQGIAIDTSPPLTRTLPVARIADGAVAGPHENLNCVRLSHVVVLGASWGCEARARYLRHYLSLALADGVGDDGQRGAH
ncbi:hypothetical protein QTH87_13890 [Variovorax sp. J22P168]|uniref:hypothetical protein n=1 Tax=Variovorax jilinensis TaxID=3053513 RepID=UPI002577858E|nr:hypothetical protein [Variovorax sp. J22P168]MDM0013528.1 hypothetical protein [Variovorax sp. J22P168]